MGKKIHFYCFQITIVTFFFFLNKTMCSAFFFFLFHLLYFFLLFFFFLRAHRNSRFFFFLTYITLTYHVYHNFNLYNYIHLPYQCCKRIIRSGNRTGDPILRGNLTLRPNRLRHHVPKVLQFKIVQI